jgi:hypothetical protein
MPGHPLKRGRFSILALLVVLLVAAAGLVSAQVAGRRSGHVAQRVGFGGGTVHVAGGRVDARLMFVASTATPPIRETDDLVGGWEGPMGTIRIRKDSTGVMTVASWIQCSQPDRAPGPCDADEITVTFLVTSATATQVRADVVRSTSVVLGKTLKLKRGDQPRETLELDIGDPGVTEGAYYFCRVDDPNAAGVECS